MSADNCIAILKTTDKFKVEDNGNTLINTFGEGITAYRVAHIQAVDNFQYYMENEIHNLGAWMYYSFGNTKAFYDYADAIECAKDTLDMANYVEYGIVELDASNYNFPWC